jgi:hypothetical protein
MFAPSSSAPRRRREGHERCYPRRVTAPGNLADPDFEPTDEDLVGLSKRAFAGVRSEHEESLRKLRAEIARQREAALQELSKNDGTPRGPA